MTYSTLKLEHNGVIASITLNRPGAMNALSEQLRVDLIGALRELRRQRSIRALVLTGGGQNFCAGADLKEGTRSPSGLDIESQLTDQYNVVTRELRSAPYPTIAAVNGIAAGAGCSLALACDFILAAKSAQFIQIFTRIAAAPDAGSSFLLPRAIGRQRALGMMMTNEPVSADTALEWGLAWNVYRDDELVAEAKALAEKLATQPTRALIMTRRLVDEGATSGLDSQMAFEAAIQGMLTEGHDAGEAVAAFVEKRPPSFKGH